MGIFNFFSTGLVLKAVEQISKRIKETSAYKYFGVDNTQMIKEYKDFECTMIASAIATIAINLDLNDPKQKKDIQTVYIGKCAGFLRKVISKEYKLRDLQVDEGLAKLIYRGNIEAMLISKIHVIFEQYLNEIKIALRDKSPMYLVECSDHHIGVAANEEESREELLFDFIWNLLLAEEEYDLDDENNMGDKFRIGHKLYFQLSEKENDLFYSFMADLELIVKE